MARTSQADARAHTGSRAPPIRHVGVWVQYKGTRARTLQTTKTRDAQAGLTSNITNEFLADLEALKLTLPGLPMVDIRIVWGTGQVRAGYGLKKEGLRFDVVIKYLVKRASTEFLERMSELSIARLWYIEDGSPVEINKLPSRLPASLRPPIPANAPQPTSSSDKLLNTSPTSPNSQSLVASSSVTASHFAPSAQPSLASCVQPPADRLQTFPSAQEILSLATESRARQAPPFQSLQAPSVSHQDRWQPPSHPIALQAQSSNEKGIGRDPRSYVGAGGKPSTAPGPNQPPSEVLAPLTVVSKPLAAPDSARSCRPRLVPQILLTSDACSRLKDPADDAVLAIYPVVSVLVLRSMGPPIGGTATKSYEAFVTDGREYMWLAFAPSAAGSIGDRDDRKSLQVGSAVRLKTMSRLSSTSLCPVLVHDVEIMDSLVSDVKSEVAIDDHQAHSAITPEISAQTAAGITIAPVPHASGDRSVGGTLVHNERALLLADAKFQEERRRRVLLERALADVCGDLHRLENLYPAAAEVLKRIDKLVVDEAAAAAILD